MLAPPPPPPPPRGLSAPPPPEPATTTPRAGGVRLFQSRVIATPTVTNKQTMRPAGTPRHDGMAAAKDVIFGGQASWLARGSGTPRSTKARGSRTAAAARKHMRSDVDEVVFGRDMDRTSGAEAADDSVIREADLADGIRPAGGKPTISAKTVRGKVRARRAPLPDTLRSHRRSLLGTCAPRHAPRPSRRPSPRAPAARAQRRSARLMSAASVACIRPPVGAASCTSATAHRAGLRRPREGFIRSLRGVHRSRHHPHAPRTLGPTPSCRPTSAEERADVRKKTC